MSTETKYVLYIKTILQSQNDAALLNKRVIWMRHVLLTCYPEVIKSRASVLQALNVNLSGSSSYYQALSSFITAQPWTYMYVWYHELSMIRHYWNTLSRWKPNNLYQTEHRWLLTNYVLFVLHFFGHSIYS